MEFDHFKERKSLQYVMMIFLMFIYLAVAWYLNNNLREGLPELKAKLNNLKNSNQNIQYAAQNEDKRADPKIDKMNDELKVPFYIYDTENIRHLWKVCYNQSIIEKRAALLFVEQLRNHRWRTYNPDEASLFVIPVAFMDPSKRFGDHYGCEHFNNSIKLIMNEITNSVYFRRNDGRDHLLVDPWWRTLTLFYKLGMVRIMDKIVMGVSGAKKIFMRSNITYSGLEKRCAVYVPFDPNYSDIYTKPINERQIDYFFLGEIDSNKPFRKNVFQAFPSIKDKVTRLIDVGNVLQIKPCESMDESILKNGEELIKCKMNKTKKFKEWTENSKFSLMLRGHDYQSERLFAAMSFGTINLIFSDYIYETGVPFQCFVPWRDFSFQVNSTKFLEDPLSALQEVISLTPDQLSEIQNKIVKYQPDVLWNHPQSRVAENVLKSMARKCYTVQNLIDKNMDQFLRHRCEYKDTEDRFGDKIELIKEIH